MKDLKYENIIDFAWNKFNKEHREIMFNELDHDFLKFLLEYNDSLNVLPKMIDKMFNQVKIDLKNTKDGRLYHMLEGRSVVLTEIKKKLK